MAEINVFDRISELKKRKAERDSTASVKKGQIRPIERTAADSVFDMMATTRPAVKTETEEAVPQGRYGKPTSVKERRNEAMAANVSVQTQFDSDLEARRKNLESQGYIVDEFGFIEGRLLSAPPSINKATKQKPWEAAAQADTSDITFDNMDDKIREMLDGTKQTSPVKPTQTVTQQPQTFPKTDITDKTDKTAADSVFDRMEANRPSAKTEIKQPDVSAPDSFRPVASVGVSTETTQDKKTEKKPSIFERIFKPGNAPMKDVINRIATGNSTAPGNVHADEKYTWWDSTLDATTGGFAQFNQGAVNLLRKGYELAKMQQEALSLPDVISKGITGKSIQENILDKTKDAQIKAGVPDWLIGDPVENLFDKYMGYQDKVISNVNQNIEENTSGAQKFVAQGTQAIAGMAPTAALTLLSGGASATPQIATGANVLGLTPDTLMKFWQQLKQMAPFGLNAAGNAAYEAEKAGANLPQQLTTGAMQGFNEMMTEMISFGPLQKVLGISDDIAKPVLKKGLAGVIQFLGNQAKNTLESVVSNVIEEPIADLMNNLSKKAIYDPDMPVYGEGGVIDPEALKQTASIAIAMSVIMAALGLPVSAASNVKARQYLGNGKPITQEQYDELKNQIEKDAADIAEQNGSGVTFTEDQAKDFIPVEPSKIVPEQSTGADENIPAQKEPAPVRRSYAEELDDMIREQQSIVEDIEYRKNYLGEDVEAELAENTQKLNSLVQQKQDFETQREQRIKESEQARQFEQWDISDYLRGIEATEAAQPQQQAQAVPEQTATSKPVPVQPAPVRPKQTESFDTRYKNTMAGAVKYNSSEHETYTDKPVWEMDAQEYMNYVMDDLDANREEAGMNYDSEMPQNKLYVDLQKIEDRYLKKTQGYRKMQYTKAGIPMPKNNYEANRTVLESDMYKKIAKYEEQQKQAMETEKAEIVDKYRKKLHSAMLNDAIDAGKTIPENILQNYPFLRKKYDIMRAKRGAVDNEKVSGSERIPVAQNQTGRGQPTELQGEKISQGQVIDASIQGEDISSSLNARGSEAKQPHSVGNTVKAYDNDNNEYEFSYALVNADDLISSHDTDMNINQQYPQELQPRDRTRISSKAQIEKMAGSIQPELLGENPKISDGAPIIGPDNIVESGNGRVIALKKMYQSMKGKDTTYQEWLRNNAEKFGLDPDNLPNNPVLVRVRKSDVDRNEFVKKANETSVALMSSTETAKSDAERLNDRILEMFVANEDGVINTADNRPFISAFTGEIIPSNELGRYITPEGYLSQDGLMRVRNAIFYKAYGSDKLLTRISESTDNNIKNITNSLINIAPQIVSVKNGIQKGSYFPIDYASDITAAVEKFVSLKENKTTVEEYLRQLTMLDDDMTASSKAVMYIMEQNSRSAKKLTEFFNTVLNAVEELGNPNQVSIFEDRTNVNKEDVLYYAYRRFEDSGQESFGTNTESKSGGGGEVESILRPQNGQKGTDREKPERKINNSGTRAMTSLATESEMPQGNSSSTGAKTVDDIIEIIENTAGVPIRTGKFRQKALGIFKVMPEVIRTKVRGDLPVIMHELGHYYDKKHNFSDSKAHEAELLRLGRKTSKPSYSKEQIRGEGVAEFMRLYMINPAEAKTKAPQFFAEFENQISKEELAFFTELRRDVLKIVNLPSAEKVMNTVSMGESRKTIVKQSSLIRRFIDSWINSNAPFERAQQEAEDAGYTGGNLARAAELYRGMEGKIMNMFTDKQRDLSGNPVFKSLQEILEPISAKATKAKKASPIQTKRDFVSYAISKRAMDYKDRNLNMPLPWFVYENTIQEMEAKHPEFVDVFSDLRQWEDNSLQWLVDSGIKTQQEVEVIKQMNVNHMPLQRIQEALEVIRPGSGASMGQSKDVVKRAVGSGATIIDPLESIISNAFIIYRAAEANKTLGILHDMAKKVERIGDLVEIVPTGMKGTTFTVEEIRAQLYKMAKANKNSDLADVLSNLSDEEMETAISVFRPLMTERDREITYYNNGKKVIMQVETELYKAIKGLNNTQTNPIIKALSIPKKVLQFGVVTTVDFTMRNLAHDTSTALIQSEVGINPFDIMKGYISAISKDKSFKALIAAGGGTEYFNMNDRTAVQKIEDDALGYGFGEKLNALGQAIKEYKESKNPRAVAKMLVATQAISKVPFDFIRNLVEFSEMGSRIAEFEKALRKGYSKEEAASFARKVTQDFRRSGYTGRELNKAVAFFNPNIQGTTRVIETFAQHPARTMLRGLLYVTLPTMLLYGINHDDDEYKRLPDWRKSLFWNIPIGDGKFIPIPKPYGYGWVFGALPEITLDKILNDTPETGKRILDSFLDNFNIPMQMTAMTGAMEVATNKSWNNTPIEGAYDRENKPAYLIRNTRTSTLAKAIGDMLKNEKGLSPKQIDYLVKSYFGSVGEFFWRLPDTFKTGIQTPQKLEDYPIIKKFVVDSTFSNESTNKLYDYQEELRKRKSELKETGEYKAVKHLPEKEKETALKELDNIRIKAGRTIDDISDLRKEITDIEQSDLSQAAKDEQTRAKQQEINRLAETYNAEYEALKKKYHIR